MDYTNVIEHLRNPATWTTQNERTLLEPYTYIAGTPGKEIRGRMIEAFNEWLHVPEDKLKVISRVISMLHSGSLLMDDVEDDSQLRRGFPGEGGS